MTDFMYDYDDGLYFNLTNRCPCCCFFCIRSKVDSLGSADNLWLKHEPTVDEVIDAISAIDIFKYQEIVFCGYGEPMERVDAIIDIADFIKENYHMKIRINTNGLGDLIHDRDTVDMIAGHVDAVSVSLNAPNNQRYMDICKPSFGEAAYPAMLEFAEKAVKKIPDVTMSVVDIITPQEIEECKKIAENIGAKFRVRNCY